MSTHGLTLRLLRFVAYIILLSTHARTHVYVNGRQPKL